jgi:peptidoglycan lytic transglycosylase G
LSPTANRSALLGIALAAVVAASAWIVVGAPSSVPEGSSHDGPVPAGEVVLIDVVPGETAATIGQRLKTAGVIDNANSFRLLARLTGAERQLEAGEYEFGPGTSVLDALSRIRAGLTSARNVTVPEGLRVEQVAALLDQRGVVPAKEFLTALKAYAPSSLETADLLSSRPIGQSMEGFLFPATYSFSRRITATEAVEMMVKALTDRFTPQMRDDARRQGLSPFQVLTLASIVEREAIIPEDRPLIASVYLNRLKQELPLQADPTVQYAVAPATGVTAAALWKRDLTADDLKTDSPYNTYVKKGLPPGPIASPGLDSIRAVLHPADTTYLYFVARPNGSHAFSTTFAEHEQNVERYARP